MYLGTLNSIRNILSLQEDGKGTFKSQKPRVVDEQGKMALLSYVIKCNNYNNKFLAIFLNNKIKSFVMFSSGFYTFQGVFFATI